MRTIHAGATGMVTTLLDITPAEFEAIAEHVEGDFILVRSDRGAITAEGIARHVVITARADQDAVLAEIDRVLEAS